MWRGTVVPQSTALWDKPNALKQRAKEHPNDTTVGQPFMFHYALWPLFGASLLPDLTAETTNMLPGSLTGPTIAGAASVPKPCRNGAESNRDTLKMCRICTERVP